MNPKDFFSEIEYVFFKIRDYVQTYGSIELQSENRISTVSSMSLSYSYKDNSEILIADDVIFLYNHQYFTHVFKKGSEDHLNRAFIDIQSRIQIRNLLQVYNEKQRLY
jgi:hypothetical protein